ISLGSNNTFNSILLFLSYLLIWSDKLYQFPFSSWILNKFGEEGFNVYSLLYIVLILLNIAGWIIGQRISNKENNKIKLNVLLLPKLIKFPSGCSMLFSTDGLLAVSRKRTVDKIIGRENKKPIKKKPFH
ncbi:MAG: hypothetical protein ACTSQU_05685, partial [Promethearchaeota archaeon]